MIQLNLLPSIKAEYVKTQRAKRSVVVMSVIVSVSVLGIVGLLASVAYGAQAIQLNNLEKDIDNKVAEIKAVPDLDKILTIRNQIGAVNGLHTEKPVMTRLFTYLQQTTPKELTIDTFTVDNENLTWKVEGKAPSIELINKYVDTLKFTEIAQTDENSSPVFAFKEVVLADFSKSNDTYTYTVTFKFDQSLYSSANPDIKLVVPSITTTRSQTQLPSDQVFVPNPEEDQQ